MSTSETRALPEISRSLRACRAAKTVATRFNLTNDTLLRTVSKDSSLAEANEGDWLIQMYLPRLDGNFVRPTTGDQAAAGDGKELAFRADAALAKRKVYETRFCRCANCTRKKPTRKNTTDTAPFECFGGLSG
jgi:hypothetical protein